MKLLPTMFLAAALCAATGLRGADGPPIETAPAVYQVKLDTSLGEVVIEVTRANAPLGADKFYSMVRAKVLDGSRFFRVIPGMIVQFGIAGDPAQTKVWGRPLQDDPRVPGVSNKWASVSYAKSAKPNTRTTQVFINLDDNRELDGQGFVPFGKVIKGMSKVRYAYANYGEAPDQNKIEAQGNAYLLKNYPRLDYIKTAVIVAGP